MKRIRKVYKKTVSIVNETAIGMYQNLVGRDTGDFCMKAMIRIMTRLHVFRSEAGGNPYFKGQCAGDYKIRRKYGGAGRQSTRALKGVLQ